MQKYEIIWVEYCGPDNTWMCIQAQFARDTQVKGLQLSRDFGKNKAIAVGREHANGEWVVVKYCDLQDYPEEIPALYQHTQEQGYVLVFGRRNERQGPWLKRMGSRAFYWALSYLTETRQHPAIANFGIYHRKGGVAVLAMQESIRYFPTMVRWVGFQAGRLAVTHAERTDGTSSYNLRHCISLPLNIILAYSGNTLRLTVKLGLGISAEAFGMVLVTLLRYLFSHVWEIGYVSLIIPIWFFAGLIPSVMGIVSLYIGKAVEQVKKCPLYLGDLPMDSFIA